MTVYFLQSKNGGPVKIGFSDGDEAARRAILQIGSAGELVIIRSVTGGRTAEAWFHKQFREHRIRGEWFDFHETMLTTEVPPAIVAADAATEKRRQVGDKSYLYDGTDFASELAQVKEETARPSEDRARAGLRLYASQELAHCAWLAQRAMELSRKHDAGGNRAKANEYFDFAEQFLFLARQWEREVIANAGAPTRDEKFRQKMQADIEAFARRRKGKE